MAVVKVLGRSVAAVALVLVGLFGLAGAASAQDVGPYPTPTTEGPDVSASTVVQDDDTIPVSNTSDTSGAELANTGSESGRVALLGLAALGTGGVCIAAARRRATA